MAGPYYVDPAAAGTNDGSSWTNAWTSLQTAADTAVAGEVVYCRGTQVLSVAIDFDTNAGTNAGGYIQFIGCNASGNRDGTRFVVDCNNAGIHGIVLTTTADMVWFENIEVHSTGGTSKNGFFLSSSSSTGCVFVNCSARDCSGIGVSLVNAGVGCVCSRCVSHNNTGHGFQYGTSNSSFLFCCAHDNGLDGFSQAVGATIGCLSYDNTDDGFGTLAYGSVVYNCVSDNNGDDGVELFAGTTLYNPILIGTRITNHSGSGDVGLNANSKPCITMCCYFEDNDGDNIQNGSLHYNMSIDGTANSSNVEDQANTTEGYTSLTEGSENYNLASGASLFSQAITIPAT